jgi:hypothetical protein
MQMDELCFFFITLPSSEFFALKAQNIGTLGLGAHGHTPM